MGRLEVAIVATLLRGRQELRAVATSGSQSVASPPVAVDVRAAAGWSPGPVAGGRYRDAGHPSLRLTIDPTGRRLHGFSTQLTATCVRVGAGPTVEARLLAIPPVAIAPDGSFVLAATLRGQRVWIQGRVTRTAVTGYASWQGGSCSGDLDFTARRAAA